MMEMTEKCLDIPQVMNAILEFQPISLEWGDFSQIYFLVKKIFNGKMLHKTEDYSQSEH